MLKLVELTQGDARDVGTVDALMKAAFDPRYGEGWTPGQCLGVLALPGVWLTLAHFDGRPVGFSLARAVPFSAGGGEAELLLIATQPKARRCGVGAALLRAVIDEARGRGAARLHLEVRANNDAIPLYTAHGFAKVGERRDYYRPAGGRAYDAHTYARDL
ncbi:MAG: GNAT family N-acetyltransferase [Pseudomonadota bacterium]